MLVEVSINKAQFDWVVKIVSIAFTIHSSTYTNFIIECVRLGIPTLDVDRLCKAPNEAKAQLSSSPEPQEDPSHIGPTRNPPWTLYYYLGITAIGSSQHPATSYDCYVSYQDKLALLELDQVMTILDERPQGANTSQYEYDQYEIILFIR